MALVHGPVRRSLLALTLVAVTALGFVVFAMGDAGAWKCNRHPEQSTCTTTVPPTTEPVTYTIPSTTSTTVATTTTTASSTTTTVPDDPYDPPQSRRPIRFAG